MIIRPIKQIFQSTPVSYFQVAYNDILTLLIITVMRTSSTISTTKPVPAIFASHPTNCYSIKELESIVSRIIQIDHLLKPTSVSVIKATDAFLKRKSPPNNHYKSVLKAKEHQKKFIQEIKLTRQIRPQLVSARNNFLIERLQKKQLKPQQNVDPHNPLLKILNTRRFKRPRQVDPQFDLKLNNLRLPLQEKDQQRNTRSRINSRPKQESLSSRLKHKTYLFQLINYDYVSELGRGGYARVILCKSIVDNNLYAVKIYDKLQLQSKSKISNIQRQIKIMQSLHHPNISHFKQSFENKTTVYLVMEYCGSHSLFSYINDHPNNILPEKKAKKIFLGVLSALLHMKDQKIAHRDIKAENILLIGQNVKLIDFGFSIFLENNQIIGTFCGTPTYMAPEIVSRQPHDPFRSDVWSLGVLLFLMLQGQYPFMSQDETLLFEKIKKGKYKIKSTISKQAKQLIDRMLVIDFMARIELNQIINVQWLS